MGTDLVWAGKEKRIDFDASVDCVGKKTKYRTHVLTR